MRRLAHTLGALMIGAGILTLAWAVLVWRWEDPFTAAYTHWQQHKLASSYDKRLSAFHPHPRAHVSLAAEMRAIRGDAARYRRQAKAGEAIGRIRVPRMGINMLFVNGTDHESLKKGPGRDARSYMPGQGQLIYVAGHRTTYLAPFSHIDSMRKGDRVTLELPYATFVYRVTGHRVVVASDLSVLKSHNREVLELQACHPRFFASHRYIVFAKPVQVIPRGGEPFSPAALALGAARG